MRITQWDLPNETFPIRLTETDSNFKGEVKFSYSKLLFFATFSNEWSYNDNVLRVFTRKIINWRILYFIKWISRFRIMYLKGMLENMRKTMKKWKQQILIKQRTSLFVEQNITLWSNNSLIDQLTYRHRKWTWTT